MRLYNAMQCKPKIALLSLLSAVLCSIPRLVESTPLLVPRCYQHMQQEPRSLQPSEPKAPHHNSPTQASSPPLLTLEEVKESCTYLRLLPLYMVFMMLTPDPLRRLRIAPHGIMIPPFRRRARLVVLGPAAGRVALLDVRHAGGSERVGEYVLGDAVAGAWVIITLCERGIVWIRVGKREREREKGRERRGEREVGVPIRTMPATSFRGCRRMIVAIACG